MWDTIMRMKLWVLVIVLLLAISSAKEKNKKKFEEQPITVTYVISEDSDFENDLISMVLKFQLFDASLTEAYEQAEELTVEIQKTMEDYCENFQEPQDKKCGDMLEKGLYNIEPVYQKLRGKETFKHFSLSFDVVVHVKSVENIGVLVDQFVHERKGILESMTWEDILNHGEEQILEKGVSQGEETCSKLGMKLKKINSVTIVEKQKVSKPEPKEEAQGQEEEEEAPQEDQSDDGIIHLRPEITHKKFKFEVVCSPEIKAKRASKK